MNKLHSLVLISQIFITDAIHAESLDHRSGIGCSQCVFLDDFNVGTMKDKRDATLFSDFQDGK